MEGLRQFDVCINPDASTRRDIPLVVILQSDFVLGLRSVVVAPVRRKGKHPPLSRLAIEFSFKGNDYVVALHELATLQTARLQPAGLNVTVLRERIVRALDLLFTGI